jgi:hypothetical protein
MDVLQLSQVINAELTYIQQTRPDILDQKEVASIFNSAVTCITEGLVEALKFTLVDRQDPSQAFASWGYDLSDSHHITRSGPDLRRILEALKRLPQGRVYLSAEVRWSDSFLSMDRRSQERILQNTYWGQRIEEADKKSDRIKPLVKSITEDEVRLRATNQSTDFGPLELDLFKLEDEVHSISKNERATIYESVKHCILKGYCRGVHFKVLSSDRERSILQWGFELDSHFALIRTGATQEQVLALFAELGRHRPPLHVVPVLTQKFEELSPKEQHEAMKDTMWAADFKKKGLFG